MTALGVDPVATLPMNFNSPYKARSVAEFWRRWHMSLSTWLRDYLYIPMGGNRGGSLFSYIMLGVIVLALTLLTGWLWLPVAVIAVVTATWSQMRCAGAVVQKQTSPLASARTTARAFGAGVRPTPPTRPFRRECARPTERCRKWRTRPDEGVVVRDRE